VIDLLEGKEKPTTGGAASGDASSFSLAYTHRCLQRENEMRIRIWVWLGPLLFWFVPAALGERTRQQLDLWVDSNALTGAGI
jgi:hypothetical protein